MKLKKNIKQEGFTLAEVLITLAIIGIVAALTIPSIVKNAQEQQFRIKLKKILSIYNQALIQINNIDGPVNTNNQTARNQFMTQLKTIKYGRLDEVLTASYNDALYRYKNGTPAPGDDFSYYDYNPSYLAADGHSATFVNTSSFVDDYGRTYIVRIVLDLNAAERPNMVGMDIHEFYVINDLQNRQILMPSGFTGSHSAFGGQGCIVGATTFFQSKACTYQMLYSESMP